MAGYSALARSSIAGGARVVDAEYKCSNGLGLGSGGYRSGTKKDGRAWRCHRHGEAASC